MTEAAKVQIDRKARLKIPPQPVPVIASDFEVAAAAGDTPATTPKQEGTGL